MLRNHRTMTLKLSRIDVCNLLMALTVTKDRSNAQRWRELHQKIKAMLEAFDEQLDKEDQEREQANEVRRLKARLGKK